MITNRQEGPRHTGAQETNHNCGQDWLTIRQASAYMTLSEKTVRRLVRRNRIHSYQANTAIRVSRLSIDDFMATGGDSRRVG